MTSESNVAFVPLTTIADISFWSSINSKKLHEWKLDESPVPCFAEYSIRECFHVNNPKRTTQKTLWVALLA